jgi:hypothetical protein
MEVESLNHDKVWPSYQTWFSYIENIGINLLLMTESILVILNFHQKKGSVITMEHRDYFY